MKYIKYIATLAAAALLSGCVKDVPTDTPDPSADYVTLDMEVPIDAASTGELATRGFDSTMESYIETIDILIFEHDGNTGDNNGTFVGSIHGTGIQNTAGENGGGTVKFRVNLPTVINTRPDAPSSGVEYSLIGKSIYLYTLANVRKEWNDIKGDVEFGDRLFETRDKLVFMADQAYGDDATSTPKYLPMYSESAKGLMIKSDGRIYGASGTYLETPPITVARFVRRVAAIDIGFNYVYDEVSDSEIPTGFDRNRDDFGFKIEEAALLNVGDRGYITNKATSMIGYTSWAQSPEDMGYINLHYGTERSAEGMFNRIYIPEFRHWDKPVSIALLIGGYYTGPGEPENTGNITWYRVDLYALLQGQNILCLNGNYRYTVKVDYITGPGGTFEDAMNGTGGGGIDNSLKVNFSAVPWSEGNSQDNNLGGRYGFDISQSSFRFIDDEARSKTDSDNVLELQTDYSGGWRVESIEYDGGEAGSWLSTDIIQGDPFTAAELHILMKTNATGNGRVGYINLSAGHWTHKIKVQQGEYIKVTPFDRTIAPWSFKGYSITRSGDNEFYVETEDSEWWIDGVTYPSGLSWGLTATKTVDGRGFYIECPVNQNRYTRTALVNISTGTRTFGVEITQDWSDCGLEGVVKNASFGGSQSTVGTQLVQGIYHEYAMWPYGGIEGYLDMIVKINNLDEAREVVGFLAYYDYLTGNDYTCWMVENSHYDPTSSATVVDGEYYYPVDDYLSTKACPPGWRLPGMADLYRWEMFNLAADERMFQEYFPDMNTRNVSAAFEIILGDDDILSGYYDPREGVVKEKGLAGHFPSGWDGYMSEAQLRAAYANHPSLFSSEAIIQQYLPKHLGYTYNGDYTYNTGLTSDDLGPSQYNWMVDNAYTNHENYPDNKDMQVYYSFDEQHPNITNRTSDYSYLDPSTQTNVSDYWEHDRLMTVRCVKDYAPGKWR